MRIKTYYSSQIKGCGSKLSTVLIQGTVVPHFFQKVKYQIKGYITSFISLTGLPREHFPTNKRPATNNRCQKLSI